MKSNYFLCSVLAALGVVLIPGAAWAQNSGTVNDAFQTARQAVKPELQTKVVSLYGIGSPGAIGQWYVIFYDPTVPSHGRAVLVENHQITKSYPANGGMTYSEELTFDPSRITREGPVLSATENYAAKHAIAYDSVRVLLRQTSVNKPFRWRVELFDGGTSRGYVYVNALDDTVAYYAGPSSGKKSSSSDDSVEGFANDVKNTFLGIGGDLEEFFTGQRTVDK
ncbi:MAG TPA: hypothetical protein VGZ93_10415 [Candidatus Methylacidiphilales bacterium]|jgi:hypothetical protein|nr:hypothetical protein [Candidatus Methylacidiphilales bacterium]